LGNNFKDETPHKNVLIIKPTIQYELQPIFSFKLQFSLKSNKINCLYTYFTGSLKDLFFQE